MTPYDLTGRTVVVTGANAGIGVGLARGVGRAGAAVAIWARNEARNQHVVDELCSEGIDAWSVSCDVAEEVQVDAAMRATLERFGQVDTLFANAGIAAAVPFVSTDLSDWQRVLRTNLDGSFLTTRAAARHMIDRGMGGSIVVVSSMVSRYGAEGQAAYAVSKNGLIGLGRTLAVELARYKIRTNILVPGWTVTDMNDSLRADERFVRATTGRIPVRRWGTADDFVAIAPFLADPALTYHTGNEVVVDGGYTVF